MKDLILLVNKDTFFLSHRLGIALEAQRRGRRVTIVTRDSGHIDEIRRLGFEAVPLPMPPSSISLKADSLTLLKLIRYYRRHPGCIYHHVGMKLILMGSIAASLTRPAAVVNAVCGLGSFVNLPKWVIGGVLGAIRRSMQRLQRRSPQTPVTSIFQNHDDPLMFKSAGVPLGREVYLHGSGVDLTLWAHCPEERREGEPLSILFSGRMLRSKGVEDFCSAAELLREEMEGKVVFDLCGGVTGKPGELTAEDMHRLTDGRYIRWHGDRSDISEWLRRSAVIYFPSYYREGLPKSLIEAAAIGRPIITADSLGSRAAIEDGRNGYLVAPRSPEAAVPLLRRLIGDPALRDRLGRESRRLAEERYDIRDIVEAHMRVYDDDIATT